MGRMRRAMHGGVLLDGRNVYDPAEMTRLGFQYLGMGRALDAHEHFQTIVRERPSFLDAAAMLGLACYLAGDGLAARAVWEELRARRPEDPRVEAYLALLSRSDVVPVGVGGEASVTKPERKKKKK